MKRILCALCFVLCAFFFAPDAFAQGTTSYPTSIDTSTTLPSPVDNKFTAVTVALNNSATTATVASTTGFRSAGIVIIDSEQIAYTSTTLTTFTGLTRGFGGTVAAAHAVNATVKVAIVSAHVNGVRGATLALEAKIGIGSSDASAASTNDVLTKKSDGTTYWHAVTSGGGIGDVVGPSSAVNNRIAVFDGTTGKLLKDGGSVIADLQPIDSDLTAIAALSPSNDDIIQRKAGVWTNRTIAQLKTDLSLSGTNTGDQTITLTGDVTGSGTGSFATTIGAGKVTNSMLAGSIAYSKLSLTAAILNADLAGSIAASKLVGSDIATVGTITSGVWNGTNVAVANGGTGSSTASGARTNLGVVIGTDVEAHDSDLTTIAGLTATTDNFIVSVSSAWASRTPAQVKTTLSLNNVENTALSTWAGSSNITTLGTISTGTWSGTAIGPTKGGTGLTSLAQGDLIYGSASNTFSALAKNTSSTRYLSNTGTSNNPAWAQIDLTSGVTGILPLANGGTGNAGTPITSTPTPVAFSGTLTSASAVFAYVQIGKLVFFHTRITITTNGTGAVAIQLPLPVAAAAVSTGHSFTGRANGVSSKLLSAALYPDTSTLIIQNYDGTYPAQDGELLDIEGVYFAP